MRIGSTVWRFRRGAAWAALAVVLSGCTKPPDYPPNLAFPPRADRLVLKLPERQPTAVGEAQHIERDIANLDSLGGRTADPATLPAEQRQSLDRILAETFGKPASPVIHDERAASLDLTSERLTEGGKLYRRQCVQCHGMVGDGRGPTGLMIHPHPRDFRRGMFKFVSTGDGGRPRRDDLLRTIREGLPDTAMPAFKLLPDGERELIATYVVYLSVRGQVEYQALAALLDPNSDGSAADDLAGFARERLRVILGDWEKASRAPLPTHPPEVGDKNHAEYADGVRRGYELFTIAGGTSCVSCHEDFGRKTTYRYDIWGTVTQPANLTEPQRKGGTRPEDVYQRVRGGIAPSGMPAHASLTDRQAWDLTRFVRSLPYPRELPPDVRAKVYPGSE